MTEIPPVIQWQYAMKQPALHSNDLMIYRLRAAYKSLTYITGKKKISREIIAFNTKHMTNNDRIDSLLFGLNSTKIVLAYIENTVLKYPKKWSGNKYKEALHFLADVISYIIEDIEAELKTL